MYVLIDGCGKAPVGIIIPIESEQFRAGSYTTWCFLHSLSESNNVSLGLWKMQLLPVPGLDHTKLLRYTAEVVLRT